MLMIVCAVSCACNLREAKRIKNFPREYTGLDTLIRIDGYYYREYFDFTEVVREYYPDNRFTITWIIFSENGGFKGANSFFRTHKSLQNSANSRPYDGYYTIVGDTIKAKGRVKFQPMMWNLFERHYLIENDTTLRLIRTISTRCPDNLRVDREIDEVYKFFKYQFDNK